MSPLRRINRSALAAASETSILVSPNENCSGPGGGSGAAAGAGAGGGAASRGADASGDAVAGGDFGSGGRCRCRLRHCRFRGGRRAREAARSSGADDFGFLDDFRLRRCAVGLCHGLIHAARDQIHEPGKVHAGSAQRVEVPVHGDRSGDQQQHGGVPHELAERSHAFALAHESRVATHVDGINRPLLFAAFVRRVQRRRFRAAPRRAAGLRRAEAAGFCCLTCVHGHSMQALPCGSFAVKPGRDDSRGIMSACRDASQTPVSSMSDRAGREGCRLADIERARAAYAVAAAMRTNGIIAAEQGEALRAPEIVHGCADICGHSCGTWGDRGSGAARDAGGRAAAVVSRHQKDRAHGRLSRHQSRRSLPLARGRDLARDGGLGRRAERGHVPVSRADTVPQGVARARHAARGLRALFGAVAQGSVLLLQQELGASEPERAVPARRASTRRPRC